MPHATAVEACVPRRCRCHRHQSPAHGHWRQRRRRLKYELAAQADWSHARHQRRRRRRLRRGVDPPSHQPRHHPGLRSRTAPRLWAHGQCRPPHSLVDRSRLQACWCWWWTLLAPISRGVQRTARQQQGDGVRRRVVRKQRSSLGALALDRAVPACQRSCRFPAAPPSRTHRTGDTNGTTLV